MRLARGEHDDVRTEGRAERARHLLGDGEAAGGSRRVGGADSNRNRSHHPSVSQDGQLPPRERRAERPADRLDRHVAAELDPAMVPVRKSLRRHLAPSGRELRPRPEPADRRAGRAPRRARAAVRPGSRGGRRNCAAAVQRAPRSFPWPGRPHAMQPWPPRRDMRSGRCPSVRNSARERQPLWARSQAARLDACSVAFVPAAGGATRRRRRRRR